MSFLGFGGVDDDSPFSTKQYNGSAIQGRDQVRSAAGPDLGQDQQSRQGQLDLAKLLTQQANGGGPNPAGLQMQQGMAQNAANAMALQASGNGAQNPGMGAYYAQQGIGQANQNAAGQAAQMRLAQQMQARGALGGLYGQMRGADQSAAQMGMMNNQFNAGQFNNQLGADTAASNAMRAQQNSAIAQQDAAYQQWLRQFGQQLLGGVANAAGGAAQSGSLRGGIAALAAA